LALSVAASFLANHCHFAGFIVQLHCLSLL